MLAIDNLFLFAIVSQPVSLFIGNWLSNDQEKEIGSKKQYIKNLIMVNGVEKIRFPSFGTRYMLEGEYTEPTTKGTLYGVTLCHPHPLYGGNMNNIMISKLRDGLCQLGITTIRFNFRGTGLSEGEHSRGNAEVFDIMGASRYLVDNGISISKQVFIGYSFGAAMLVRFLHDNPRPLCFVGIALPTAFPEYIQPVKKISVPSLLVSGELDNISSLVDAQKLVKFKELKMFPVPGGNHLFTGVIAGTKQSKLSLVVSKVIEFVNEHVRHR